MRALVAVLLVALAAPQVVVEGPVVDYGVGGGDWVTAWLLLESCPEDVVVLVNGVPVEPVTTIVGLQEAGGYCNLTIDGSHLSIFRASPGLNVTIIASLAAGLAEAVILFPEDAPTNSTAPGGASPGDRGLDGLNTSGYGQVDTGLSEPDKRARAPEAWFRMLAATLLAAASLVVAVKEYGRVGGD